MKCKQCGAVLSSDEKVCPGCLRDEGQVKTDNIIGGILIAIILILTITTIVTIIKINNLPLPRVVDESRLGVDPTVFVEGPAVFRQYGDVWNTVIKKGDHQILTTFNYRPGELKSVNNGNLYGDHLYFLSEFLANQPLFITYDPLETNSAYVALAIQELKDNLPVALDKEVSLACSDNLTEECQDLAQVNGCKGIASKVYVREYPKTEVLYLKNCVIIQGEGEELIKAAERFLFTSYGIMDSPRFTDWTGKIPDEYQNI